MFLRSLLAVFLDVLLTGFFELCGKLPVGEREDLPVLDDHAALLGHLGFGALVLRLVLDQAVHDSALVFSAYLVKSNRNN